VRSTWDELSAELGDLRTLVTSIGPVNLALSKQNDSTLYRYVSIRRRFDYAAFTVALYASFEKFVESLLTAFVRLETRRLRYSELPPKLTAKHLNRTAEMLWRGSVGQGRYLGLTEFDAVRNLFQCLEGRDHYLLNEAIVTAHDANLRAGEVDALFAVAGIENICDRACQADAMISWYSALQGFDTASRDAVDRMVIDQRLEDIVERRNQVSHRGGSPAQILGPEAMSEAVDFIESLSQSLFGLVVGRYLQHHHTPRTTPEGSFELALRSDDGPFQKRTVVVVDRPSRPLYVGQPVFVLHDPTGARWGRIRSLMLNGTGVEVVQPEPDASDSVGVALSFRFPQSKQAKLVALTSDDDLVWSPQADSGVQTSPPSQHPDNQT